MDIYCTNCGEGWDVAGLYPAEQRNVLSGLCDTCGGDPNRAAADGDDVAAQARAALTAELAALMPDDPDGIAAELDDAEALGVFA